MNKKIKIAPSLFAADFYNLKDAVAQFEKAAVDMIHYDIMDNHFVPNISFGLKLTEDIIRRTSIPANVHLMVSLDHNDILNKFLDLPVQLLTIHLEATGNHIKEYLKEIKKAGKSPSISIRPKTPVEAVLPYLDDIDLVLIMSVEPGFSGQKFMPDTIDKIKKLRALIGNKPVEIQVDGGVEKNNYQKILDAGADFLVIGTAFYKENDSIQWVKDIHNYKTA